MSENDRFIIMMHIRGQFGVFNNAICVVLKIMYNINIMYVVSKTVCGVSMSTMESVSGYLAILIKIM